METLYIIIFAILFVVIKQTFFTDRSPIPESSEKVYKIKEAAELDALLKSSKHLVVDFYADWCPPCRAVAPHFSLLADEHALEGRLAFAKVNVDHVQKVAGRYGVTSMPTFMFFEDGAPRGPAVEGVQGCRSVVMAGDGRIDKIRGADPVALQAAVKAWAEKTDDAAQ
ncbi:hypothetical protein LQW54_005379 [Pestalotiopsis sp. IQ-011]